MTAQALPVAYRIYCSATNEYFQLYDQVNFRVVKPGEGPIFKRPSKEMAENHAKYCRSKDPEGRFWEVEEVLP